MIAIALLAAALLVAACRNVPAAWHPAACTSFVRLNEGIELGYGEDVAERNIVLAEQVRIGLTGADWMEGGEVRAHLLDATAAATDAGRASRRQDSVVWIDRMREFAVHMSAADDGLTSLGLDCGPPLRWPART